MVPVLLTEYFQVERLGMGSCYGLVRLSTADHWHWQPALATTLFPIFAKPTSDINQSKDTT